MAQITKNFNSNEFKCPCCGKQNINKTLVEKLEVLRSLLGGRAITITSGYRCPKHNKAVNGSTGSLHTKNTAVDLQVKGLKPYEVYYYASKVFENGGVGIYKNHIHVDVGSKRRWEG